jgi:TolB-like protein/DNA-binding winged helix-turn-helix (wHTH) protein
MSEQRKRFYEFGPFRVDVVERHLSRDGERVPLAPMVFNLLLVLIQHSGQVLERTWLKEQVWGGSNIGDPDGHALANLNVYIATLRKALGDTPSHPRYIGTVARHGYRFIADVREWEEEIEQVSALPKADKPDSRSRRRFLPLLTIGVILVGAAIAGYYYFKSYSTPPPKHSPVISVAVLPFKLLNDDDRDRPLEKGLAATLIPRLSNINEIRVLHLDIVCEYLDQRDRDLAAIGRGLHVNLVLTGNIQRAKGDVRVIMQLIQVKDGRQLWTGTFDEKFTNVLSVQDSISKRAVAELAQQLMMLRHMENVEAFGLYQQ